MNQQTDTTTLPDVPEVVYDEKGRALPEYMIDRELLIELTVNMRALADAIEGLGESPMVKAMLNGSNPLMAMMGR